MMLLYFGTIEVTQGFTAQRKLIMLARSLADLTAQSTGAVYNSGGTSDPADVTTIFSAATSAFYPFTGAQLALTSVRFAKPTNDSNNVHAYTAWSVTSNGGTARACGELAAGNVAPAVPSALFTDQTSIIVADTSYTFLPLMGSTFHGIGSNGVSAGTIASIPMQQSAYMQPRAENYVDWTSPTATKCPKPTYWPSSPPW